MKKYFYLFALIILSGTSQVFGQVPTMDFENWTTFPEAPSGWFTSSIISPIAKPVSRTTDKQSGTYAMKLETKDTIGGLAMTGSVDMSTGLKLGFPFNKRAKSVSFYYKYTPDSTGDSMNFSAILSRYDTTSQAREFVGIAAFTDSKVVGSYIKQVVNFNYDSIGVLPDTLSIIISNTSFSENPKFSVLFIDAITFDTSSVSSVSQVTSVQNVSVNTYPNPVQYITNFTFELSQPEKVTIKLYDMVGKEVATVTNESKGTGKHVIPFDASSLNEGIYFYQLVAGKASGSGKLNVIK